MPRKGQTNNPKGINQYTGKARAAPARKKVVARKGGDPTSGSKSSPTTKAVANTGIKAKFSVKTRVQDYVGKGNLKLLPSKQQERFDKAKAFKSKVSAKSANVRSKVKSRVNEARALGREKAYNVTDRVITEASKRPMNERGQKTLSKLKNVRSNLAAKNADLQKVKVKGSKMNIAKTPVANKTKAPSLRGSKGQLKSPTSRAIANSFPNVEVSSKKMRLPYKAQSAKKPTSVSVVGKVTFPMYKLNKPKKTATSNTPSGTLQSIANADKGLKAYLKSRQ